MRFFSLRRLGSLAASLLAFLAVCTLPVHAQSTTDAGQAGQGSIYSRYGLGMLQDFSSSQADALGGGAYGLRSLNYNAMANPALWSDQVFTRVLAGARFEAIDATDASGQSSTLSTGSLDALQFSFPIYKRTLGVGISFQPYSRANYETIRTGRVITGATGQDTLDYQIDFEGVGGLQQLRGGAGFRINDALSVGASVDVIFGILEQTRNTTFPQTDQLAPAFVTDRVRLSGVTGTVGAHLSLASVFMDDDALSLGSSVTLPASLTGERTLALGETLGADEVGSPTDGSVDLPMRTRVGAAYQFDERWTFVADGLYEPWSNFESDFDAQALFSSTFPVGGEATMNDRWRVSTGVEVVPAGDDQLAGYFARTGYRVGGYVEQMYVRPNRDVDLRAYAATFGLSLPTSLSGTRIDLNGTVGMRGTTNRNLVRDIFYGVSLYLNFGERWFQERKLR